MPHHRSAPPPSAWRELTRQAEGLWQTIAPLCPGFTVEVLPTLDSTNAELMRRARAGEHAPVLLVALEQTAGRGRRGRTWYSQPGDALTFSLGLPLSPRDWSGLSLVVGLSLAEQLHPELRLKWPNDLWWQGRKLGGILVETASVGAQRYAVLGVGINLVTPMADWPAAQPLAEAAVALPSAAPVGLQDLPGPAAQRDAGECLAAIVPALVRDVQAFAQQGFAPFVPRYAQRDVLLDQPVWASDGQTGTGAGVGPDGALRLRTAQGEVTINSAEVSVRPC